MWKIGIVWGLGVWVSDVYDLWGVDFGKKSKITKPPNAIKESKTKNTVKPTSPITNAASKLPMIYEFIKIAQNIPKFQLFCLSLSLISVI